MKTILYSIGLFMLVVYLIPFSHSQIKSCNCVAFRLDDIQDFHLNNAQIAVIDLFESQNASFTIGIIGNHFGNDTKLVDHIKEVMKNSANNNFQIEIANHGWNHEDFRQFNKVQQSELLNISNKKISSILGVTPKVFIAPMSLFNNDTIAAAKSSGIRYFSASITTDPIQSNIKNNTGLYHFPENSATGDIYENGSNWFTYSPEQVINSTLKSLDKFGYALIVMHPQEHSIRIDEDIKNKVDWQQIKELNSIIEQIKNKGLKIVTIEEINQNMKKIPGHNTYTG